MPPPSSSQRALLVRKTLAYHEQLLSPEGAPLLAYLKEGRGFTDATIEHFMLGAVLLPESSDESVRGWISIPFMTPAGPVAMRYRRPPDSEDKRKYWQPEGSNLTLFNVGALQVADTTVVISEGEMDCIALHQCGVPAIGVPGGNAWKESFIPLFEGYERVIITADNDGNGDSGPQQAGKRFAATVARDVPGPEVILCPEGHDINSHMKEFGVQATRDLLGIDRKHDE